MRIFHEITLSSVGEAQSVAVNLANAQAEGDKVWVISLTSGEKAFLTVMVIHKSF